MKTIQNFIESLQQKLEIKIIKTEVDFPINKRTIIKFYMGNATTKVRREKSEMRRNKGYRHRFVNPVPPCVVLSGREHRDIFNDTAKADF